MPGKILIIEDDSRVGDALVRLLNHAGHDTLRAETAAQAISRALTERPDLVLTDLHLPDMIAPEAIAILKNNPSTCNTPVIVLTAEKSGESRNKVLEAGAVEYATKPIRDPI